MRQDKIIEVFLTVISKDQRVEFFAYQSFLSHLLSMEGESLDRGNTYFQKQVDGTIKNQIYINLPQMHQRTG